MNLRKRHRLQPLPVRHRDPSSRRAQGSDRDGRRRRRFRDDDAGVSEAVGYIITFGISTVILVTSLSAMTTIQDYTQDISRDRAADEVAAQVAFQVQQALKAGKAYPEASADLTIPVPRDVSGTALRIELTPTMVYVNSTAMSSARSVGALGTATAPILNSTTVDVLCVNTETVIVGGTCQMLTSPGEITIRYGKTTVDGVADQWGVYIRNPVV